MGKSFHVKWQIVRVIFHLWVKKKGFWGKPKWFFFYTNSWDILFVSFFSLSISWRLDYLLGIKVVLGEKLKKIPFYFFYYFPPLRWGDQFMVVSPLISPQMGKSSLDEEDWRKIRIIFLFPGQRHEGVFNLWVKNKIKRNGQYKS